MREALLGTKSRPRWWIHDATAHRQRDKCPEPATQQHKPNGSAVSSVSQLFLTGLDLPRSIALLHELRSCSRGIFLNVSCLGCSVLYYYSMFFTYLFWMLALKQISPGDVKLTLTVTCVSSENKQRWWCTDQNVASGIIYCIYIL